MPRMPVPKGSFQLTLPVADNWLKMIGRARSEGYVQGRSVSISDEELERVRNASQQCSNCHAAVTAPILWGRLKLGVNIVV